MTNKQFYTVLILGVLIAFVFLGVCNRKVQHAPAITSLKEMVKEVANAENIYKKKYDSLQINYNKLKSATSDIKLKLANEQINSHNMGEVINHLLNSDSEKSIDLIKEDFSDYLNTNQTKDSLCNELAKSYEKQIANKDSVIVLKDTLYGKLRNSFDRSMEQNKTLTDYSKDLKKQIRREKITNFFWKAATVVAGVFIVKTALK